jgi:hypothetical protein
VVLYEAYRQRRKSHGSAGAASDRTPAKPRKGLGS